MDIIKELTKQAKSVMSDAKKKEKIGDTIEGALKEVKKNVKDDNTKKMLDGVIKKVDDATTTKKKTTKKKEEKKTTTKEKK